MLLEKRLWNALNAIAIAIPAFTALYSLFYIPSPFTHKELQSYSPVTSDVTSAFQAFRTLGNDLNISITKNNQPIDNLSVSVVGVRNSGSVPILPKDFFETLSINVAKPWKILAVKNTFSQEDILWTKVTDQQFNISPQLLNPGDTIVATVYATNAQFGQYPKLVLQPYWRAHIVNMEAIEQTTNVTFRLGEGIIAVYLNGWSLFATCGGALFFLFVYVNLLYRLNIIQTYRWVSVLSVVGVAALSLAAAESMATYLVPNTLYKFLGVSNLFNLLPIMGNLGVLIWLSLKAWGRPRNARSAIYQSQSTEPQE